MSICSRPFRFWGSSGLLGLALLAGACTATGTIGAAAGGAPGDGGQVTDQEAPPPGDGITADADGDPSGGDTLGSAIRLDAGLDVGTTTYDGKVFSPLLPFLTSGVAYDSSSPNPVDYTEFDSLYQKEDWVSTSPATFVIPVANGDYTVHLHFADVNTHECYKTGDRVFHVDLQGNRVLPNFDIIDLAGKNAALVRSFDVSVTDGNVTLTLTTSVFYAQVSAVEILPRGEAHLAVADPPVRCNEGAAAGPCLCNGSKMGAGDFCCSGTVQTTDCGGTTTCTGPSTQPCVTNGTGNQSRTCNNGTWSSWGTCTFGSCNDGYTRDGDTCVPFSGHPFYVTTGGSDSTGDGSSSNPWASLHKACASVSAANSIIHVGAGRYTENTQCVLAKQVSIEGEGTASTTVVSGVSGAHTPLLYLSSPHGTDGSQHISGIYFDGNGRTTDYALQSYGRSNVEIYNCTFIDFDKYGIMMFGNASGEAESTSVPYATGIKIHDCTITNNAYYESGIGGGANIFVACVEGAEFHHNTVTQQRASYTNGCGFKCDGWTRGVKIYNNTYYGDPNTDDDTADSWNFSIEWWGDYGSESNGLEIYGNTLWYGQVDISGRYTGPGNGYSFGADIYNNTMGCPSSPSNMRQAMILEENVELNRIYVHHNRFQYVKEAISMYMTNGNNTDDAFPSIYETYIYYNEFVSITGFAVNAREIGYGGTGLWPLGGNTLDGLYIYNNTIRGSGSTNSAIIVQNTNATSNGHPSSFANISIINNIIQGFTVAPFEDGSSGTISNLTIRNNDFYGCGNSNDPRLHTSTYTNTANVETDPALTSATDFHLGSTSGAIDHGYVLTFPVNLGDMDRRAIGNSPEIGAHEY